MDAETLDRVDRLASREGSARANRSRLIRQAVQEYVSRTSTTPASSNRVSAASGRLA
jgi:metal-responsive CopG/Arc/MetJ family transcriptional regulator